MQDPSNGREKLGPRGSGVGDCGLESRFGRASVSEGISGRLGIDLLALPVMLTVCMVGRVGFRSGTCKQGVDDIIGAYSVRYNQTTDLNSAFG